MAEKELRRLNRRELLKLLLMQCEEMDRVQREYSEMKADLEAFMESYERLKGKLNIKDERLNEKDARIAELTKTIEDLKKAKAEVSFTDDMEEAAIQVNKIFEEARRQADQYLKKNLTIVDPFEASAKPAVKKRQSLIQLGRRPGSSEKMPGEIRIAVQGGRNGQRRA